jgi:hypothetical protein
VSHCRARGREGSERNLEVEEGKTKDKKNRIEEDKEKILGRKRRDLRR